MPRDVLQHPSTRIAAFFVSPVARETQFSHHRAVDAFDKPSLVLVHEYANPPLLSKKTTVFFMEHAMEISVFSRFANTVDVRHTAMN